MSFTNWRAKNVNKNSLPDRKISKRSCFVWKIYTYKYTLQRDVIFYETFTGLSEIVGNHG
jgi:hypothetical protein